MKLKLNDIKNRETKIYDIDEKDLKEIEIIIDKKIIAKYRKDDRYCWDIKFEIDKEEK